MDVKKARTSAIAVATAAAIALSGTFAWQSISQQALNETKGANPGGRLHDDFSGYNSAALSGRTKDVYVENFGSQVIYARVRLDEYMEIGTDAGTKSGATGDSTATSLVSGADIDDVTTWTTHLPGSTDVAGTDDATADPFHDYWTWEMGGDSIAYMPTFNKNTDSLAADINGTLEGTTEGDDVYYDDYVAYADGDAVTADAFYDADDNAEDEGGGTGLGNGGVEGVNYGAVSETHTAQMTNGGASSTVITMAAYNDLTDDEKANLQAWVYDADGWAYWSQPIQPGEATGLLLDSITLSVTPNGEWYYAINAVAQFITADDLGKDDGTGFYDTAAGAVPTSDALSLLSGIGVDVGDGSSEETEPAVTVALTGETEGSDAVTAVRADSATTFTAAATDADGTAVSDATYTWTAGNASGSAIDGVSLTATTATYTVPTTEDAASVTSKSVVLTVDSTVENGTNITLTCDVTVDGVTYTETHIVTVTKETVYGLVVKAADDATEVLTGGTLTFTATATQDGAAMATQPSFTWSAADASSNEITGVSITDGALSVGSSVPCDTEITVTATATISETEYSGTATVRTVYAVGSVVALDDIDFVVMATDVGGDSDHILLLSKYILEDVGFDNQNHGGGSDKYGDNVWRDSQLRTYLNSTEDSVTVSNGQNGATTTKTGWLKDKTEISAAAVEYTIYTQTEYNDQTMIETKDKIFLLSQADVFGTYNDDETTNAAVTDTRYYTIGEKLDLTNNSTVTSWAANHTETDGGAVDWWWLRSPHYYFNNPTAWVASVTAAGTLDKYYGEDPDGGVRPAFVASISAIQQVI